MKLPVFTLRMSRHVSDVLLPDLKALIPLSAMQFFSNELDEEWHYTVLCLQSEENCSLAVSAIAVWHQLHHIQTLNFTDGAAYYQSATQSDNGELFRLLLLPGAVMYLS